MLLHHIVVNVVIMNHNDILYHGYTKMMFCIMQSIYPLHGSMLYAPLLHLNFMAFPMEVWNGKVMVKEDCEGYS